MITKLIDGRYVACCFRREDCNHCTGKVTGASLLYFEDLNHSNVKSYLGILSVTTSNQVTTSCFSSWGLSQGGRQNRTAKIPACVLFVHILLKKSIDRKEVLKCGKISDSLVFYIILFLR